VHRSQLFKHPPRFKQLRPREQSIFEESSGAQDVEVSDTHGITSLPFASAAVQPQEEVRQATVTPGKPFDHQSKAAVGTDSYMATSASGSDVPIPSSVAKGSLSPSANHRSELVDVGSPGRKDTRTRREGSEGTPSMGSSFSDIDGQFEISARSVIQAN
jgi:hypothetical protein